jgi:hypothetical protein
MKKTVPEDKTTRDNPTTTFKRGAGKRAGTTAANERTELNRQIDGEGTKK